MFDGISRFRAFTIGVVIASFLAAVIDAYLLHDFNEWGEGHVVVFGIILLTFFVWTGVKRQFVNSE